MHRHIFLGFAFFIALLCAVSSGAENWPHWRGPFGTGVAAAGDYPVKFSNEDNVVWKVKLPGYGTSTPAVWNDRIFVTSGIDGRDGLVCYDTAGKELWRKQFGEERPGKNAHASGSNPSPATDGEHLVVYYKSGTLVCLDLKGNEKWTLNLQEKFGKDTLWWDLGTSPVLCGDRVIVAVYQGGDSYLAALNLANGEVVWKEKRQYDVPKENDNSYCTPQIVQMDGKDVIVSWGADHLTGHDAASGKLLWECGGFNPDESQNWRTIASAVVGDGIAIVPSARGDALSGIRIGGTGDITKTAHVWDKAARGIGADVPTPVVVDGKVIVLTDRGRVICRKLETGDELWSADLPQNRNKYYGSPILAGDKLYCVREDGVVFVGRVSEKGFEQLAENKMGERILATPIAIRGKLLLRGDDNLFLIGSDRAAGNSVQ